MKVFPKFDKKLLYRWVAILAIIGQTLPIFKELGEQAHEYYIVPKLIRNSYIADIQGDFLDMNLVKKHLDKFNELGHNVVVKYKVSSDMDKPRPITIEVRALGKTFYEELNKYAILAYATSRVDSCTIVLRNDMVTEIQFRNTLIHELLHCYLYDHTKDKKDLMYYSENNEDLAPSIKKYAEELEQRIK